MEYFDICDEKGMPTGKIIERKKAHEEGILHRTAHIWVVRKTETGYDVLLQKRALNKDSFPGQYDTSSAGHIQAGDEPKESAIRELGEELGIHASADQLTLAGTFRIQYTEVFYGEPFRDNEVAFVFVYKDSVDIDSLVLQEEEIDSVAWFDLDEVWDKCVNRDPAFCVPTDGLEVLRNYLSQSAGISA
ncbi:MAG: NUDIX domain-containing protein [Lachnospiraceae bacterium]|nr:NUDIX domain-containing protein [Lachnospiraceae bacterium]